MDTAAVDAIFEESLSVKTEAFRNSAEGLVACAGVITEALRSGGKVLVFGNGGSAADSQHFAAELVGRFRRERRSLPAVALTTDTSILTALANDYGFDSVFTRQIEALGRPGDAALGITTSGRSPNVVKALHLAGKLGLRTMAWTGAGGRPLKDVVEVLLTVPSTVTARIQEVHICFAHVVCELVEAQFTGDTAG